MMLMENTKGLFVRYDILIKQHQPALFSTSAYFFCLASKRRETLRDLHPGRRLATSMPFGTNRMLCSFRNEWRATWVSTVEYNHTRHSLLWPANGETWTISRRYGMILQCDSLTTSQQGEAIGFSLPVSKREKSARINSTTPSKRRRKHQDDDDDTEDVTEDFDSSFSHNDEDEENEEKEDKVDEEKEDKISLTPPMKTPIRVVSYFRFLFIPTYDYFSQATQSYLPRKDPPKYSWSYQVGCWFMQALLSILT